MTKHTKFNISKEYAQYLKPRAYSTEPMRVGYQRVAKRSLLDQLVEDHSEVVQTIRATLED